MPNECTCNAWNEYECGCEGVDWRSDAQKKIEADNKQLRTTMGAVLTKCKNLPCPMDFCSQISLASCITMMETCLATPPNTQTGKGEG